MDVLALLCLSDRIMELRDLLSFGFGECLFQYVLELA